MAEFRFDDSKSFAENYKAFLEAVKADDPEMAVILHDNLDKLVAVVREGEGFESARRIQRWGRSGAGCFCAQTA